MGIRDLIEKCRRQQRQLPGQLEIPEATGPTLTPDDIGRVVTFQTQSEIWPVLWATEDEALEEWRREVATGVMMSTRTLLPKRKL